MISYLGFFYFVLTFLLSLVLAPFFALHPRGRIRLKERFGIWGVNGQNVVWFHGASVGEIEGILPLIRKLRTDDSEVRILVTSTSPTGIKRAEAEADWVRLLPFDNPVWLRLALRTLSIRLFICAETELWPALLLTLHHRMTPMVLVNGKISDFTISRYRFFSIFMKPLLSLFTVMCVENESYEERFRSLGAPPDKLRCCGSTKYDRSPGVSSKEHAERLKQEFFPSTGFPVLVLGSIRPGEEEFWFPAIQAYSGHPTFHVIVAPRHQERFDFFANSLEQHKIPFSRWSKRESESDFSSRQKFVILLDTIGDLESTYSFADLAFIGATLIPGYGGHNPLEAAAYGACVVLGPYTENVKSVKTEMLEQSACVSVTSRADVIALLDKFSRDPSSFQEIGERGKGVWSQLNGATDRIVTSLKETQVW